MRKIIYTVPSFKKLKEEAWLINNKIEIISKYFISNGRDIFISVRATEEQATLILLRHANVLGNRKFQKR